MKRILLVLLLLTSLQSCMYYYKVQTVKPVTSREIKMYDSLKKYLIFHQGDSAWHLTDLGYTNEQISGDLSVLPGDHMKYKTTKPKGGNRFTKLSKNAQKYNSKWKDESNVLTEVHLYLKDTLVPSFATGDNIQIAYSAINKAEVYKKDQGRTSASWIIPAVGVPLLAAGAISIIVALTKSSCPFVYIKNGNDFSFAGEIFGGAVYASLERHDYMPLPGFDSQKKQYSLVISNGLPEIQYINLAELWIVHHPVNVTVLPDRRGVVHSIIRPEAPVAARSSAHADLLPLVTKKDKLCFLFDEDPSKTGDTCAFNTAYLTFAVPEKADTGKLIIRAGNSLWGDYNYGEFTKLFGTNYGAWIKKQGKEPAEKNSRWKLDQRFALMVYLETENGWQFVDYFDLIGPLGARDLIMPVDLDKALITNIPDHSRTIRIKLESGFKFWDLDCAAMDFSRDKIFSIDIMKPSSTITESGKDVTQSLSYDDSLYYIQENTGEEGLVVFRDSPGQRGMKKSVFLHTKGYYEHVRNYPNSPDIKELQTFLIPGRFSKFSYDNHKGFVKNNWAFAEEPKLP